jgi:hypothetical protein
VKDTGHPEPILRLYTPEALDLLESEAPVDGELVQAVWRRVAPLVRAADPERYRSVCQALELPGLPVSVLAEYILRESRMAMANPRRHHQRLAQ